MAKLGRKFCGPACAKAAKREYVRRYQQEMRARERDAAGRPAGDGLPACLICGGPVPKPRKKYCSDECYRVASRHRDSESQAAVLRGEYIRKPQGPRPQHGKGNPAARKKRPCLKCDREFLSLGPENRLCSACRQENENWRRKGGNMDAIYWLGIGSLE